MINRWKLFAGVAPVLFANSIACAQGQVAAAGSSAQPVEQPSADAAAPYAALQEIVVTARRREESLQEVPTAITGFSSEQLANLQIQSFGDIGQQVPNLDVQNQFGSANAPQFYLRGIASGLLSFQVDSGIGLYVDGVYLGRPAGSAFDLSDIERVEVLRGPQGTLFGRNSTGGAINFVTRGPSGEFGVQAEATYGNYDRMRGRISVDLPAFGPLSARLTYLHDERDGFVDNLTPGITFDFIEPLGRVTSAKSFGAENTDAFGAAVRLDLDRFVVDYRFDYTKKNSTQFAQQALGFNPDFAATGSFIYGAQPPGRAFLSPTHLDAVALDFTGTSRLEVQGHSLTAVYDITDDISIKSITAYRKFNENVGGNDIDGGALIDPFTGSGLPFTFISSVQARDQKQWSEEIQLLGTTGNIEWILGGFYFRETGDDDNPVFLGSLFPPGINTPGAQPPGMPPLSTLPNLFGVPSDYFIGNEYGIRNKSYAGYAHADLQLTDALELSGGVRYTKDKRREALRRRALVGLFQPPATFSNTSDHWDFDAALTYSLNDNVRVYAKFATGYLSGGTLGGVAFKPETIENYEVGLKGDFLDKTLRINAALFHADRKNIQIPLFTAEAGTTLAPLPKVNTDGIELEVTAVPTDGLEISGTFGYLDESISQALGPRVSTAPKYTVTLAGQYDFPQFANGSYLSARVDSRFVDDRLSNAVPFPGTDQLTTLGSRVDINARLSLVDLPLGPSKARLSAWVRNLTDNKELEFSRDLSTVVIGTFQEPRTYGLDLSVSF